MVGFKFDVRTVAVYRSPSGMCGFCVKPLIIGRLMNLGR